MHHKTRVENRSYEPGELLYVHCEVKQGKGKKSASTWLPGWVQPQSFAEKDRTTGSLGENIAFFVLPNICALHAR